VAVDELRRVIAAIEVVVGADAPVDGLAIAPLDDGGVRVDITTSAPGRIIGRRGATADALRERVAEHLRVPDVLLNILETPPR
jgi:ribosomal protein S3